MNTIEKAIKLLSENIGNEEDLGKSVLLHSLRILFNLQENGYGEDIVVAGILHDLIEDSDIEKEQIEEMFGKDILEMILVNSKNYNIVESDQRDTDMFNRCKLAGMKAMIVKGYDILDNYNYFSKQDDIKKFNRVKSLMDQFVKISMEYEDDIFCKLRALNDHKSTIFLINGPCGIGKSTISKLLHEKLEYSILWEKDSQRRNISHYKDTPEHQNESGKMILEITKGVIKKCVDNNYNMIFDGVLWEEKTIKNIKDFINSTGGKLIHIYLNAPKSIWKERILSRGISGSLTYEKAEMFYDSLGEMDKENFDLELDTSTKSPEEICNIIMESIR